MLLNRWQILMDRFGVHDNDETYDALIGAYSEKGRRYHNTGHLISVLEHLDAVRKDLDHDREIELSLWFHDAVYRPFSKTNEGDSADWARRFLRMNNLDYAIEAMIQSLIMATRHPAKPRSEEEKIIVDIDLAVLGGTAQEYRNYAAGILYEYRSVPRWLFLKNRRALLKQFLDSERIYSNDYFFYNYEAQARKNIAAELIRIN